MAASKTGKKLETGGGGCYTPIGKYEVDEAGYIITTKAFTAKFDGGGHEIKLTINIVVEGIAYAGVFGCLGEGGEIKNLGVAKGSYISASGAVSAAGGIACMGHGATITGCYNAGTVSASGGQFNYAGGIWGGALDSEATIIGCYNTGKVSASGAMSCAGGIAGLASAGLASAGLASAGLASTMVGCYNTGAVKATGGKISYAGGIAGGNDGAISGCYYLAGSAEEAVGEIGENSKIENVEEVAEEQMAGLAEKLNEAIEEYKSSAVQTELAAIKDILQLETAPTTLDEAKSKLKTQLEASKKKLPAFPQLGSAITENENRVAAAGERDDILKGAVELFKKANEMLGLDAAPTTLDDAKTKLEARKQEIEGLLTEIKNNKDETDVQKISALLGRVKDALKLSDSDAPKGLTEAQTKLEAKNKEIEGPLPEIEKLLTEIKSSNDATDEVKKALLEKVKQALGPDTELKDLTEAKTKLEAKKQEIGKLPAEKRGLLAEIESNKDVTDAQKISALLKKANKALGLDAAPTNLAEAKTKLEEKNKETESPLPEIEELLQEIAWLQTESNVIEKTKQALGLAEADPTTLKDAQKKLGRKNESLNWLLGKVNELFTEAENVKTDAVNALLEKVKQALRLSDSDAPKDPESAKTILGAKKKAIEGNPQREKQLAKIDVLINEVNNNLSEIYEGSEIDEAKINALLEEVNQALKLSESDAPVDVDEARQRLDEAGQRLNEKRQEIESLLIGEKGLLPKIEETLAKIDEFLKLPQTGDEDGKKFMKAFKEAILTETKKVLGLSAVPTTLVKAGQELKSRNERIEKIKALLDKVKNLSSQGEINNALEETKEILELKSKPNNPQEAGEKLESELNALTAEGKEEKMGELELRINNLNPWKLETNIGKVLEETKDVLELTAVPTTLAEAKQELGKKLGAENETDKKQQLLEKVEELETQNNVLERKYKVLQDVKNALGLSTVPESFDEARTKLGDKQREENGLIGKVEEKLVAVEFLQTLFENLPEDGKVFKSATGRYPELWCEGQQSQIPSPSLSKGVNIGHTRSSIGGDSGFYKASNGQITFRVVPNPGYKISKIITSGSRIIRPGDVVKTLPECVKVHFEKV